MSKTALIFPGQGSQYVGMGRDFFDNYDAALKVYEKASDVLGFDLAKVSFDGPEEELKQTRVTQPAIFTHSIAVLTVLKEQFGSNSEFHMAAGHSLGEYSALVAAGVLAFEDALAIVKVRAEGMQKAGEENRGTMAAIIGMESEALINLCEEASSAGIVQCANFNSPGQIVISGSVAGVQKAMELAKSAGARMVKELVVSGAFHSPLMASAKAAVAQILEKSKFHTAGVPVYANVTAKPVLETGAIKTLLIDQITGAVRWEESMKCMVADGATQFYEIGPGNVLQGLLKRIDKSIHCESIGKIGELEKFKP
ncbi:MAG: ACP S-malonyltransferase [Bacteroidetes bacterium]|nr:ACP S-malonyltransferase [Bacteroidota bacterium]